MAAPAVRSAVPYHPFVKDADLARGDPLKRTWCKTCQMPGKPNAGRHRKPRPPKPRLRPVDPAARDLDARILGEHND